MTIESVPPIEKIPKYNPESKKEEQDKKEQPTNSDKDGIEEKINKLNETGDKLYA